ncbi:hypothetical protein BZG21_48155, partial [Escherichia coli]|nr:hypothetical protein [Escherichia coli]
VVVLAIVLDRFTQNLFMPGRKKTSRVTAKQKAWITVAAAAVVLIAGFSQYFVGGNTSAGGNSSANTVGNEVNYQIIGIDPGAGIMKSANKAIEDYH